MLLIPWLTCLDGIYPKRLLHRGVILWEIDSPGEISGIILSIDSLEYYIYPEINLPGNYKKVEIIKRNRNENLKKS